jgi:1-acyl-sn-glycerol-3-phosphate acyltransferase
MTRPPLADLATWRARALECIHQGIAWYLPVAVARAVRHDLAGVWGVHEAAVPPGGAIVVANHHSWWDGYLAGLIARRHGRPFGVLVDERTLRRYPFFRRVGALGTAELRAAVRHAAAGGWLFVFPEGRLSPPGPPAPFAPGAATLSRLAGAPVLPLAWRVVVRGEQYPEIYVRCGAALPPAAAVAEQHAAVSGLLARIEHDVWAAADPEAALPGYQPWWRGRRSSHTRVQRWRRWWGGA